MFCQVSVIFYKPQGHFNNIKSCYLSVYSLLEVSDID